MLLRWDTRIATLLSIVAALAIVVVSSMADQKNLAEADGDGSPDECIELLNDNVEGSVMGSGTSVSFDAPSGQQVQAICIKSGENTFNETTHSGPLTDGTYDFNGNLVPESDPNACYQIAGTGTGSGDGHQGG